MSLFGDGMILYIEDHKDSTKIILEIVNKYSKVAEYKINVQKSTVFLYTNKNFRKCNEKRNNFFCNCNQKSKMSSNELNKGCEKLTY